MKQWIVTADDYGLSHHITDTILESADNGLLNRVSILANGYAVDYALEEWKKRKDKLSLSLHFNLTEGKALSNTEDVPHLTQPDGTFRYSRVSLLLKTWVPFFGIRRVLRKEIECELRAQLLRIHNISPNVALSIDSHQHIHMIPLVFGVLTKFHKEKPFVDIRIPREPFFLTKTSSFVFRFIRHFGLNVLSIFNRRLRKRLEIPHTDYFIGTFSSGQMTLPAIQNVLAEICRKEGKSVEISFHPGEALPGELDEWKGDTAWHFSLWRRKERELIQNAKLKTLLESFSEDKFVHPSSPALEVFRFFISGSTAAATNLILLYIFTSLLGIWYIASLVIAYAIAIIVSFSLQKFWTFSHYSLERTRSEIMWYILNNILGLSFNAVLLYILVEYVGLWYMYAQFIPLVILSIWNFFVFRFFIFPKPKSIDEN